MDEILKQKNRMSKDVLELRERSNERLEFFGDTVAFQISRFLRKASNSSLSIVEKIMSDISEYLRFEVEMLPDELLINEFNNEVDYLRNETELISKRINKLNNILSKNSKDI